MLYYYHYSCYGTVTVFSPYLIKTQHSKSHVFWILALSLSSGEKKGKKLTLLGPLHVIILGLTSAGFKILYFKQQTERIQLYCHGFNSEYEVSGLILNWLFC